MQIERLEERVVMSAFSLFDFAKKSSPTVSDLTKNVTAEDDQQPWAQGPGGSTVTYVTEQPVTIYQGNISDVLKPAQLYAPGGASYNKTENKVYIENNPLYLLPSMTEDAVTNLVRAYSSVRNASLLPPDASRYDIYTDYYLNKNLPPVFSLAPGPSRFLPPQSSNSNRQIIDLEKPGLDQIELWWNRSITAPLSKNATAEEIETELNKLSSLINVGGFVTVTDIDSADGISDSSRRFTVTFGGGAWFNPTAIRFVAGGAAINDGFSRPARSLLLSTQNTVAIDLASNNQSIANGFASPLYNVESFVPTDVGFTSDFYPSFNGKTVGTRRLKGQIETSAVAGQFRSTSNYNAVETLLGYRVVDINSEYQLQPVIDPSGVAQPITTFTLNGLTFDINPGTPFILKSFDNAETQLYFDTKNDSVEATAQFEGGKLTVRVDKGNTQPALRVDLRRGTVEPSRFISFVSAEIGGVKFTSADGVSFGTDTINQQFNIGLQNLTTTPNELVGTALNESFENLTQVLQPVTERGPYTAVINGEQGPVGIYTLSKKKPQQIGFFQIQVDDPNGIVDRAEFARNLQSNLRTYVEIGAEFLPKSITDLTIEERQAIASKITVEYQPNVFGLQFGQFLIKGMPARMQLQINRFNQLKEYRGIAGSPVQFTVPNMSITIKNGVLQPIENVSVTSVQIGETRVDNNGNYTTTYEKVEVGAGSDLKLKYYPRYSYDPLTGAEVSANTFGFYGGQVPLALKVQGATVGGTASTASLGTIGSPGLQVVNGEFSSLSLPIPEVTVDGRKYESTTFDGFRGLTLNRRPRFGDVPRVYTVEGAATLKGGVGLIKTNLDVLFGHDGTKGLQLFPDSNSYLTSFAIRKGFLIGAGMQLIGNGAYVEQDPTTRKLLLKGTVFLEYNNQQTRGVTGYDGRKTSLFYNFVQARFDLPYTTNIAANALDSTTLNLFITDATKDSSAQAQTLRVNGFVVAGRHPSQNPLRVTVTNSNETFQGAFVSSLSSSELKGVVEPFTSIGGVFPNPNVIADFGDLPGESSGFVAAGVTLTGGGRQTLGSYMTLNFAKASYDGAVIAEGTRDLPVGAVDIASRHLKKAEITSSSDRVVGDMQFSRYVATYDPKVVPTQWQFVGAGRFAGRNVNVGPKTSDNVNVTIGGDPKMGLQLRIVDRDAPPPNTDFKAPASVKIAGLNFDLSKLNLVTSALSTDSKTYTYTSPSFRVNLGATELQLSLDLVIRVSITGAEVVSFSGKVQQNSEIKLGSASLKIGVVSIAYDLTEKALKIDGSATFGFKAGTASVQMTVTLGSSTKPGLVIKDGAIDSFLATVDGTFEILKLSAAAKGLTIGYDKTKAEFVIYGSVTLSTAMQSGVQVIKNLDVSLGNAMTPGIVIEGGSLKSLNFKINGEINLFKITATPEDLEVSYDATENELKITGKLTVTLAPKLTLTAGLPGDGLVINTSTGKVEVRGLSLESAEDIKFGVLNIHGLHVDYQEAANGDVTISAAAEVRLPSGLAVGADFQILNGKLNSIGIIFQKNPGILVANGLINIFRIEARIEGLSDLANFKFTGKVTASVGPLIKFGRKAQALALVEGTITITPESLTLEGNVKLVGGQLGNGTFKGTLKWSGTPSVTFNATLELARGTVRGSMDAAIDLNGNVSFSAKLGVFVPRGVPIAGGKSLGRLSVELQVRPQEPPTASYVRFAFSDIKVTPFGIPTIFGSAKIDFDRNVAFEFGARFFIRLPWPLKNINKRVSVRGGFKLFDGERPEIEILAAAGVPGSPHGQIVFNAMTAYPTGTTIDLYADHDNLGNDGLLIASGIPYQQGSQTFEWPDMTTFAAPGEPVYVYAVVSDGKHARVYSDYSPRFDVSPGFVPTLNHPVSATASFDKAIEFSTTAGRPIVVGDPRAATDPNSRLEVTLAVSQGTLSLPRLVEGVIEEGHATDLLKLTGTAANINTALDGLRYEHDSALNLDADKIAITVRALPFELAPSVEGAIDLHFNTVLLGVDGFASELDLRELQPSLDTIEIIAGQADQTPLDRLHIGDIRTQFLTGARVAISDFNAGNEFLELPMNTHLATGIHGSFNHMTGVLSLTGTARLADYEAALSEVLFETALVSASKSLNVTLIDHAGDRGLITVPLMVVAGTPQPSLQVSQNGVLHVAGNGTIAIAPVPTITVPSGATIQTVQVAINAGYVKDEDLLLFSDSDFNPTYGSDITSSFDPDLGILTLTGTATNDVWREALSQIGYDTLGGVVPGIPLTVGPRLMHLVVTDDAGNELENFVVVNVTDTPEPLPVAELTLSTRNRRLEPDVEMLPIDPELTLTHDAAPLVRASVAIVDGHMPGVWELALGTSLPGFDTEFDPLTGVLTITGPGSAIEYETLLRSVTLLSLEGHRDNTNVAVVFSVTDGMNSAETDPLNVRVIAAPFLAATVDNVVSYQHGRETVRVHDGFVLEFDSTVTGAVVAITQGYHADQDELLFTPQTGIDGTFDATTGTLTLTGRATISKYQRVLDSIAYRNSRFNPSAGDRVISYQVLRGGLESNVINAIVAVDPEVVPPQVNIGPTAAFTEDGSAVALVPNVSIVSRDATRPFGAAPEMLYAAELDVLNWIAGEDELTVTGTESIFASYDANIGRVVFSGPGTFDEYESVLRSILYRNRSQAPTTTARNVVIRVQESGLHGMRNETLSTQTIVATPDVVSVTAGNIEPINVLMNANGSSLGLGDLQFESSALTEGVAELRFVPTQLPDELLGQVVLTDGTPLEVNVPYPIDQLSELRFEPAEGGMGIASFAYSVVVFDPATGHTESEGFSQSVNIEIDGVVTSTTEQAFAAQIYRVLLDRNPDAFALADLSSRITQALQMVGRENGFSDEAAARFSVINELLNGSEFRQSSLTSLYQDVLQRDPTTNELASTTTLAALRRELLKSDEYFFLHNSSGYVSYVTAVYQGLLDRDPTEVELSDGVELLSLDSSRANYIDSIAAPSLTAAQRNALFVELLDREPTFREQRVFAGESRETILAAILATDDYFVRHAVPTNSPRIRTHVTNGFESVGIVGDVTGGKATGTLIAPQFVLVAAHTVAETPPGQVTFTIGGQAYYMEKVFLHPDYNPDQSGGDAANDIAILKLREAVTTITPSLLSGRAPKLGEAFNLVGFGQEKGAVFGAKREGSTPPVFDVAPQTFYWQHISPNQNDADPGDSGAPIFATINGTPQIIGIVSGGTSSTEALGEIGTNTRTDAYLEWIQSITGNLNVTNEADPPSLIFEADRLFVDENSGEHRVAFIANNATGLTFSVTTNRPSYFKTLFVDQDGRPEGDLVFETATNKRGSAKVFVTVTKGGLSTTRTLTIVSQERNDAPTIDPIEELILPRGSQTTLLTGISAGAGETDPVSVRLANVSPSNFFESISVTLNPDGKTAALNFTPTATASGPATLTVEVSDLDANGNIERTTTQEIVLQLTDLALTGRVLDGELTLTAISTTPGANSGVDWLLDNDPTKETPNGSGGISLISGATGANPVTLNIQSVIRDITALLSPFADLFNASNVSVPVTAIGYDGNDTLIGGLGDDVLRGSAGRDDIQGLLGDDQLFGQSGIDTLAGGVGIDTLDGGSSVSIIADEVAGELTLSNTGYTSRRGDRALAESIIRATLIGSDDDDSISTIGFTSGLATIYGGAGNDILRGGATRDTFYGEDGDDVLNGGGNRDSLYGGAGNDTINGVGGSDLLSGGTGDDVLIGGGTGNTLFETVDGSVSVSTDAKGVVTISGIGNDTVRGEIRFLQLQGGAGNDSLNASQFAGRATLNGGAGDDTLLGSALADVLRGEAGNDSLQGNAGRDTLDGGNNSDRLDGGANHADEIRYDLLDTLLADNLDLLTLI